MIGTTIGHYEVTGKLGQGGMGVVYRATDTKLDREVAIKVLPDDVACNEERLARFQREAKTLAQLNHPNIAAIHGFEQHEGQHFLVLELVEGEDLAERLDRGPLPVEEALAVCKQIAAALDAAHEKGIIHRDLKPANVMLTADGTLKILDFGLAKAGMPAVSGSSSAVSISPTLTARYTTPGTLLGTAAYMSPEQARGKPVDKRSDIWSFGCVLYECLTGTRMFQGEDVTETLASIIKDEPEWESLPAQTPFEIRLLLEKALEKQRRLRLQSMADARADLERAIERPARFHDAGSPAAPTRGRRLTVLATALALLSVLFLAGWVREYLQSSDVTTQLNRTVQQHDAVEARHSRIRKLELIQTALEEIDVTIHSVVISPDGKKLVFKTSSGLWIQHLEQSFVPRRFFDTTHARASTPFWSPDSSQVAFFTGQELRKSRWDGAATEFITHIPSDGSQPHFLAQRSDGVWLPDGNILFSTSRSGLYEVPSIGGESELILGLDDGEDSYHDLSPLPGGRGVLFTIRPEDGKADKIATWDRAGGKQILIEHPGDNELATPVYSPSGHVVYERDRHKFTENSGIWGVSVDLETMAAGKPFPIEKDAHSPSIADDGTLVFTRWSGATSAPFQQHHQMVWLNARGEILGTLGPPMPRVVNLRLSPDETQILVTVNIKDPTSRTPSYYPVLWLYSASKGTGYPLRIEAAQPNWTPNGKEIIFTDASNSWFKPSLSKMSVSNPESATVLLERAYWGFSMSRDARFVVGVEDDQAYYANLADDQAVDWHPLPTDIHAERTLIALSPNGELLAYISKESGSPALYVSSFPDGQNKQVASAHAERSLKWARDGRKLYYATGNTLMVISVSSNPEPVLGEPEKVFDVPDSIDLGWAASWDQSSDGERFLMMKKVEPLEATRAADDKPLSIFLVENWHLEYQDQR